MSKLPIALIFQTDDMAMNPLWFSRTRDGRYHAAFGKDGRQRLTVAPNRKRLNRGAKWWTAQITEGDRLLMDLEAPDREGVIARAVEQWNVVQELTQ